MDAPVAPPPAAPVDVDPFAPPTRPPEPLSRSSLPSPRAAAGGEDRGHSFDVPDLPAAPEPVRPLPAPLDAGGERPALEIPRVQPMAPTQESGEAFDEIFAEVEGLVRGTLADSIQETLEEARVAETNMRRPERPPTTDRIQLKFAPPREDDEETEPEDEAPAGPFDWGVGQASRPAGAWLLEEGAENAARSSVQEKARKTGEITGIDVGAWTETGETGQTVEEEKPLPPPLRQERAAPPAPAPAPAPAVSEPPSAEPSTGAAGAGIGATRILARKLEAEAARIAPMMDALAAKGLVDDEEGDDDEFDDDDEVSVASFKDDRPREEGLNVTPMRIVEEIRRLRRIQEILMAKGLVSEAEIAAAAPSDD